jgi:hypothetical protein
VKDWQAVAIGTAILIACGVVLCIPGKPRTYTVPCHDSVCRPGFDQSTCSCGANETMEIRDNGDVLCRCKSPTYTVEL